MEKELIKFEATKTSLPFIKVKHNNISFNLVIDTGCTMSCIDSNILDLLIHNPTGKYMEDIIFADGSNNGTTPIVEIPITIGNKDYVEQFNSLDFKAMALQV